MKLLLALSLIANCVLGILLYQKQNSPVPERLIIESHSRPSTRPITPAETEKVNLRSKKSSGIPAKFHDISALEIEDKVSRMKQDRRDFLIHDLSLTEEDLGRIQNIHRDYDRQVQAIIPSVNGGELTIAKRRALLELEEKKEAQLRRVLGTEGWKKFDQFKQKYNRSQDGLVIPMEI